MNDLCKTCEYAIFEPLFGEYKCKKDMIKIHESLISCSNHKPTKGKLETSKEFEEELRNMEV